MTFAEIQAAQTKAIGRYWGSADTATLTEWSDGGATIRLDWADGAQVSFYEDTHAEARAHLRSLGYTA
jgi:hypothetical protein